MKQYFEDDLHANLIIETIGYYLHKDRPSERVMKYYFNLFTNEVNVLPIKEI